MSRVLMLALAFVLALSLATWWLFVRPPTDLPKRADAVVVLSGTWETRLKEGLRLVRNGVVPTLVFVGRFDSPAAARVCEREDSIEAEVVCLKPEPDNTRNEIRAAVKLAEERGWRSLVLVTSTHHVSRAGSLLRRCFSGHVDVVGTDLPAGIRLTPRVFAHEWAGLIRDVVFATGC